MTHNKYNYTYQKLYGAMECLALHPDDVRKRLACAFLGFHVLRENDFPPHLRSDWNWILKQLSKFGPLRNARGEVFEGSVEHTMRRIRKETGVEIAKKIYELCRQIAKLADG